MLSTATNAEEKNITTKATIGFQKSYNSLAANIVRRTIVEPRIKKISPWCVYFLILQSPKTRTRTPRKSPIAILPDGPIQLCKNAYETNQPKPIKKRSPPSLISQSSLSHIENASEISSLRAVATDCVAGCGAGTTWNAFFTEPWVGF